MFLDDRLSFFNTAAAANLENTQTLDKSCHKTKECPKMFSAVV